jgi:hypothetical protein
MPEPAGLQSASDGELLRLMHEANEEIAHIRRLLATTPNDGTAPFRAWFDQQVTRKKFRSGLSQACQAELARRRELRHVAHEDIHRALLRATLRAIDLMLPRDQAEAIKAKARDLLRKPPGV